MDWQLFTISGGKRYEETGYSRRHHDHALSLAACGSNTKDSDSSSKSSSSATTKTKITINDGLKSGETAPAAGTLVMRQGYAAPHGTQSVAAVNVTLNGDTIVAARIDEFQYVDKSADWTGVPNSDKDLAKAILAANS